MQGGGSTTRGDTTTSRHVNEKWRCDKRQCEAEAVQGDVTGQPAGENKRQEAEATH